MDGHGQPALLYIVPCTLGNNTRSSSFSSSYLILSMGLKQKLDVFFSFSRFGCHSRVGKRRA